MFMYPTTLAKISIQWGSRGWAPCEATGRNQGNGMEIPCMYHFVGKQQLIKTQPNVIMIQLHHLTYRSVPHIRPPYRTGPPPPYIFSQSSCTIATPTLSSSRSPWWNDNARMKPASTEQLRNSPTIASMFASDVNATAHWKEKPVECLENTAVYAMANLCQSILTIKFLEDKRSEGSVEHG